MAWVGCRNGRCRIAWSGAPWSRDAAPGRPRTDVRYRQKTTRCV
ncbi:hypothetical protein C7S13_6212 [Burkholderia cepacia]|nr:hypothetical protein [Burkholderia cepacia]